MKQKTNIFENKELLKTIYTAVISFFLIAAHITMGILMYKAFRYYSMYPKVFNILVVIIVCIFIIIDIIFVVGLCQRDMIQKTITFVMALLITIGSVYGISLISKTDTLVDNVVETQGEERSEEISGIFVTYDDKYSSIQELSELKKYNGLTFGYLLESSDNSISSIAKDELKNAGVTGYKESTYTNNTDLLFALIGGKIDVAIFSSMYKAVFRADENVDYTQYLDKMNEFGEFKRDVIVESNTSTKNLSEEPFNVLLIGWSPIIGSTTIGLADAIIVASVNPKTFTVSMMSIARDSYVPISCYGGQCDKINSGRGTSMDCFVKTVENLIGEKIDFYMEINFAGFAELCGELGGIPINNPVSFELDGIYVPAGEYVADGWQALQFARERHHMPNGDFDRQQHQKEVIMQIAKKFLKHDLGYALDIFNEVSDTINTNLTFNQLASVFNLITKAKNYTGVSTFETLDMHALRITGYADWHYSDEYELPLWIYRLYEGSINESLDHMREVLGNFKSINQDSGFSFNIETPYERAPFYSLSYDEVEVHETLPPFYINLTSKTYVEALAWAKENGATLVPSFIDSDDSRYDESLDGMVVSQSVAYGKKISKYPVCNVTVMGDGKRKVSIPDYSDWDLERAKLWCKDIDVKYTVVATYVKKDSGHKANDVYNMSYDKETETVTIKYYSLCGDNSSPNADGTACACETGYLDDGTGTGTCKLVVKVPSISSSIINKCKEGSGTYKSTTDKLTFKLVEAYSRTVASGTIISVEPKEGTSVFGDSTVTITISKGLDPNEAKIPNLVGSDGTSCGDFVCSISEEYSDAVTSGIVISQSPNAGEFASKGSTINIVVSKGPDPSKAVVPQFVGTTTTSHSDFTLVPTEKYDASVASGVVISQDIEAGTKISKGSTINIVVSKGQYTSCEDGQTFDYDEQTCVIN